MIVNVNRKWACVHGLWNVRWIRCVYKICWWFNIIYFLKYWWFDVTDLRFSKNVFFRDFEKNLDFQDFHNIRHKIDLTYLSTYNIVEHIFQKTWTFKYDEHFRQWFVTRLARSTFISWVSRAIARSSYIFNFSSISVNCFYQNHVFHLVFSRQRCQIYTFLAYVSFTIRFRFTFKDGTQHNRRLRIPDYTHRRTN